MASALQGKRVGFLVANVGVEQIELTRPWSAVDEAGGTPVLIAPQKEQIQAMNGDVEKGDTFDPQHAVSDVRVADFDALVLPGGVLNPDKLRLDPAAVGFVRDFGEAGKPIAAICHGPWTLVEADIVRDKTLTSWPSLKTDIRNAGGTWQDEEVVIDSAQGYALVTSRKPGDLDAFCAAAVRTFAG